MEWCCCCYQSRYNTKCFKMRMLTTGWTGKSFTMMIMQLFLCIVDWEGFTSQKFTLSRYPPFLHGISAAFLLQYNTIQCTGICAIPAKLKTVFFESVARDRERCDNADEFAFTSSSHCISWIVEQDDKLPWHDQPCPVPVFLYFATGT